MDKETVSVLVPVLVMVVLQWAMIRSLLALASTSHYGRGKNVFIILAGCVLSPAIGIAGFINITWWLLPLGLAIPAIFIAMMCYFALEELIESIKFNRSYEDPDK